ncbi:MAG: AAA family ATPase [Burkholderiales bacterium]|jgi:hypothetical protein|nr:AAA family ATPase [Burkholderiales bacterium]
MARVIPEGWREVRTYDTALRREIETLERLAQHLPDDYWVYHGVHWTRLEARQTAFGEIDFVVVAPSGRVLLIEQKSGFLEEAPDGLHKKYGDRRKSVRAQIARNADALQARFAQSGAGKLRLETLLYCPDHRLRQPSVADIERERIVDASRDGELEAVIRSALPLDEPVPEAPPLERIHAFLRGEIALVPHVGAQVTRAEALYTRLSGGLAEWARRIECTPHRVRVVGTAGSGKTQLALALMRDAAGAGRRALYVCFNRPLADLMAQWIATERLVGAEARTYHQVCQLAAQASGAVVDFGDADAFARLEAAFAQGTPTDADRVDELIVDEGQDFEPAWRDALLRRVGPQARVWWLEDPMQNIYDRTPCAFDSWTTLHADVNWRSPPSVVGLLAEIDAGLRHVRSGSPLGDDEVPLVRWETPEEMFDATRRTITGWLASGFTLSQIAVITWHGRDRSLFTPLTQLGPHRLRRFTGSYDLLGSPQYDDGELMCDTLYRFKGRSAPCVVLTEIDFETFDDRVLRRLVVGATRATMRLALVLSARSMGALVTRLDASP